VIYNLICQKETLEQRGGLSYK